MERYQSRSVYVEVKTMNATSSTASVTSTGSSSRVRPVPSRRPKPGVRKVKWPLRSRARPPAARRCCRCNLPTGTGVPAFPRAEWGKDGRVSLLEEVVLDLERHSAQEGWDSAPRVYALVRSTELRRAEPDLADQLGLPPDADTLAALEQPSLPDKASVEDALATIAWPDAVEGCALVMERIVLPPEVEDDIPDDEAEAAEYAASHPKREDVRMIVGVL